MNSLSGLIPSPNIKDYQNNGLASQKMKISEDLFTAAH